MTSIKYIDLGFGLGFDDVALALTLAKALKALALASYSVVLTSLLLFQLLAPFIWRHQISPYWLYLSTRLQLNAHVF